MQQVSEGEKGDVHGTSSQWVAPSSHYLSATASDVKGGDRVDQRVLVLKDCHQTLPL